MAEINLTGRASGSGTMKVKPQWNPEHVAASMLAGAKDALVDVLKKWNECQRLLRNLNETVNRQRDEIHALIQERDQLRATMQDR